MMDIKIKNKKCGIKYYKSMDKYINEFKKGKLKNKYKCTIRADGILSIWDFKCILDGLKIERLMRLGESRMEIWCLDIEEVFRRFREIKEKIGTFISIYNKKDKGIIYRGFNNRNNIRNILKIGSYNINGILRRKEYIQYNMEKMNLDVILIQETHVNKGVYINGYVCLWKERYDKNDKNIIAGG